MQELPVVFSLPSMTGVFNKKTHSTELKGREPRAGAQDSGAWERVTVTEADRYGLLSAYKRMCRVAAARTGSQGRRGAPGQPLAPTSPCMHGGGERGRAKGNFQNFLHSSECECVFPLEIQWKLSRAKWKSGGGNRPLSSWKYRPSLTRARPNQPSTALPLRLLARLQRGS